MAKKTLSKDFGIFGDFTEANPDAPAKEGDKATPPSDIPNDIFGITSDKPEKETPTEDKGEEPAAEWDPVKDPEAPTDTPVPKEGEDDAEQAAAEDEIMRLIEEATAWLDELAKSEDLTPEDRQKLQTLSDTVDELTAKNESLGRQLDAAREAGNKNLEDGEWLRIYQPIIDKLEKDPQLMLFVKYMGTKNETMKNRLTDIAKDLLHTLTWMDVYALMDNQTKDSATALGTEGEEAVPPALDVPDTEVRGNKYTRKRDPTFPI